VKRCRRYNSEASRRPANGFRRPPSVQGIARGDRRGAVGHLAEAPAELRARPLAIRSNELLHATMTFAVCKTNPSDNSDTSQGLCCGIDVTMPTPFRGRARNSAMLAGPMTAKSLSIAQNRAGAPDWIKLRTPMWLKSQCEFRSAWRSAGESPFFGRPLRRYRPLQLNAAASAPRT
jgi:hypothetical protein